MKDIDSELIDEANLLRPVLSQRTLTTEVLGMKRFLSLRELEKGHWIASNHSIVFGDVKFLKEAAKEIASRIIFARPEIILTPESKSIYLAGKISEELGLERFEVCRKSTKPYNKDPVSITIQSTISGEENLVIDSSSLENLNGKRIALIDDVVTTGGNMLGMQKLVELVHASVVVKACIWVEGLPFSQYALRARRDLIYLSTLPEFFDSKQIEVARAKFRSLSGAT